MVYERDRMSCEGTVERRKRRLRTPVCHRIESTADAREKRLPGSVINSVISPVASGRRASSTTRTGGLPLCPTSESASRGISVQSRARPRAMADPQGRVSWWGGRERRRGRALRMGLTHAQAVRGTRALRAHQPEPRGRISPRFPSTVSAPTTNETRGCHAHLSSPLPPPRTPQGLRASAPDSPVRRFRAPRA